MTSEVGAGGKRGSRRRWMQTAAVSVGLLPLVGLCAGAARDALGANPIEAITHVTGEWTLRWLFVCLAITPLRRLAGLPSIAPLRRTFGLLAFLYGCLHFATWIALDHFFDWPYIIEDIQDRRFVTVGFLGLVLMTPLAVTSTKAMMRRLGRRWNQLHRVAYAAAVLGVLHYLWLTKADLAAPLVHAVVLAALLGYRGYYASRTALARSTGSAPADPSGVTDQS